MSDELADLTFDESVTGYEGPWQYVDTDARDGAFIICGKRFSDDPAVIGYYGNYIENHNNIKACVWYVNRLRNSQFWDQFNVPEGFTAPDDMPDAPVEGLARLSVAFPVSGRPSETSGEYPDMSATPLKNKPIVMRIVNTATIIRYHFTSSFPNVFFTSPRIARYTSA